MKKISVTMFMVAAATSASAQSSVSLFGVVDNGVQHGSASGGGSGSKTALASGLYSSSRLGFRGVEDLGSGLAASFWLEAGLATDNGQGTMTNTNNQASGGTAGPAGSQGLTFARRSTVSLRGVWGEVRLGRDFVPQYLNTALFDAFYTLGSGATLLVLAPAALGLAPKGTSGPLVRASNEVQYFLPSGLGGVYGNAGLYVGENAHDGAATQSDGNGYGVRVGYAGGPLDVAVSHGRTKFAQTAATGDFKTTTVGGTWNFRVARVFGEYARDQRASAPALNARGLGVGIIVPLGAHEIRVGYSAYKSDRAGATGPEVKHLAMGYAYNFSKRTLIYATAAHYRNSNFPAGAGMTLGGATIGANVVNPTSTGLDFGVRHMF